MAATTSPSVEKTGAAIASRPTSSSSNVRAKPLSRAEPVLRRSGISLYERVALKGAEQAESCRTMHAQLARHLRPGSPAVLGQQVEDGDCPIDRADHSRRTVVVAHCATLYDSGILVGL